MLAAYTPFPTNFVDIFFFFTTANPKCLTPPQLHPSSVVVLPPADMEVEGTLGAISNLHLQDPAPVPSVDAAPTELQQVGRRLDELSAVMRDIQANAVHRAEFEGALRITNGIQPHGVHSGLPCERRHQQWGAGCKRSESTKQC